MTLPVEHLTITAFRGLRDLKLEKPGRINLLVGLNDSGKTSVLEALALMTRPLDPMWWLRIAMQREPSRMPLRRLPRIERLRWLFPPGVEDQTGAGRAEIVLSSEGRMPISSMTVRFTQISAMRVGGFDDEEKVTLGAEFQVRVGTKSLSDEHTFTLWHGEPVRSSGEDGEALPCEVVLPYQHWMPELPIHGYSQARLGGTSEDLTSLLALLDPEIRGLELLQPEEEPILYVTHATHGPVPLSVYGDGVRRTLLLAEAVSRARGGLLLIDEIETAIHVTALGGVFKWLVQACHRFDVQLFVTTHSLEAIDALLAADTTPEEDVVAFKLGRHEGRSTVKRYAEEQLKWMRFERGLEVR
jgi:voltage-gated potassium channel Kch